MKKSVAASALFLFGSFAITICLATTAVAQNTCRDIFGGEKFQKFDEKMTAFSKDYRNSWPGIKAPYLITERKIAGIRRRITFIDPNNFLMNYRMTNPTPHIELAHPASGHATYSNEASDLARRGLLALIPRILKGERWRRSVEPKVIRFDAPEKLDSKTVLAMKNEVAHALYDTGATADAFGFKDAQAFEVRIGHETISGVDFLLLADQAQRSNFVRVNLGEQLNSSRQGRIANTLTSIGRLWTAGMMSFSIGFFGLMATTPHGVDMVPAAGPVIAAASFYVGAGVMAGTAALSVVGSVGSLFSQKIALLFPNFSGTVSSSEHRALKLHAARNGAKSFIQLTNENPMATEILVLNSSSEFQMEFLGQIDEYIDAN